MMAQYEIDDDESDPLAARPVLGFLLVVVGAIVLIALLAAAGCGGVPVKVADAIAVLDSNTHTLSNGYRRAIAGNAPAGDQASHELQLMSENDRLSAAIAKWAAANKKGN